MRPLRDLPNQKNFEFIGILHGGEQAKCIVLRDPEYGTHYVGGEAQYCDLIGWLPINTEQEATVER